MENKDGRQAVLVYVESYHDVLHLIRTTHRDIAITTIFILLGVTGATLLLGYWFVGRPIARLRALAGQLGEGERIAPVALRQNDEIGTLANEFDRMAGRLAEETERRQHAVDQLRHTDRLTTVGQLASGVAHELGTPLNVVSGHAELIADGELDAAQAARSARVIVEQTGAMARLIRQLLSLARRTPMEREVLDLRDVALRTVNTLEPLAKQQRVPLSVAGPSGVAWVFAEPAHLQQALMNVVVNAIQATPAGQPVRIIVDVRDGAKPDGGRSARPTSYATISVLDRGPGIPADRLPHVFEPFFTTKPAGEGTGLGLPVTDGIVRDHGGWVEVANEADAGARFTFWLPLADSLGQAAYA
jgi:signal transduction histidine kinase